MRSGKREPIAGEEIAAIRALIKAAEADDRGFEQGFDPQVVKDLLAKLRLAGWGGISTPPEPSGSSGGDMMGDF